MWERMVKVEAIKTHGAETAHVTSKVTSSVSKKAHQVLFAFLNLWEVAVPHSL